MKDILPVRRALLSAADKKGLAEFARGLRDRGVTIVSSGTTASVLGEAGVDVTSVAEVTAFPEMLDGRVKTLHPRIHAGILADKGNPDHMRALQEQGIEAFDLVAVNLYPFVEAVAAGASEPEAIEQIDIGGPAMVRAAAKNFESVAVVVRPEGYGPLLEEIDRLGGVSAATRRRLAREAFEHTMAYDAAIAVWFGERELAGEVPATGPEARGGSAGPQGASRSVTPPPAASSDDLPDLVSLTFVRRGALRYGENPHQRAGLYVPDGGLGPLGGAEVLQGKEMSFNNWLDAEAARALVSTFEAPAAVIVKHHNPCGVALGPTLAEAYLRALEGDRVSAFGGIAAFNGEVDEEAARAMSDVFTEVVVAPGYTAGALAAFAQRKNLRVVRAAPPVPGGLDIRSMEGGALVQDEDTVTETQGDMKVVTGTEPSAEQWEDLMFAWTVAARVKSNAIVLARDQAVIAVGAGQMNRLTSVDVAARHAGDRARGSVLASDAFFPFRDGIDRAAGAGVVAVIQPGGSIRDEEVVAAAEEHGMAMVFTGRRHFRH